MAASVISCRAREPTEAVAEPFLLRDPRPDDYWRGIIMFGRNAASHKFALARALLDPPPASGQLLTLEEFAVPYSAHICEHSRSAEEQAPRARAASSGADASMPADSIAKASRS